MERAYNEEHILRYEEHILRKVLGTDKPEKREERAIETTWKDNESVESFQKEHRETNELILACDKEI